MTDPHSKPEIIDALRQVQHTVAETVQRIPAAQFERGSAESWSPADYLKHLLLSFKPFAKAISFPPAALKRRFGEVSHPPMTFSKVVARYQARLDEGVRAEDYEAVTPATFRLPEGSLGYDAERDLQTTLLDLWNEAHERMFTALDQWTEADLDTVQILHPAIGSISVREMLFFTLYHNNLHGNDIRKAGVPQA